MHHLMIPAVHAPDSPQKMAPKYHLYDIPNGVLVISMAKYASVHNGNNVIIMVIIVIIMVSVNNVLNCFKCASLSMAHCYTAWWLN